MALFADLEDKDFDNLHAPIDDLELAAGATLYAEGAPSSGIFTIRRGMVKLVRITQDGRQRIVRVLRPGDIAGLEALATRHYDNSAIALHDVAVCRIPTEVIRNLDANSAQLHLRLLKRWHAALKQADDWLAELNFGTARQRVANLILKMRASEESTMVTLFGREDMGAMLDLTLETVSRELSNLVRKGTLASRDKQGRLYEILNLTALVRA